MQAQAGKPGWETMKMPKRFWLLIGSDGEASTTQLASFSKNSPLVCNLEGPWSSHVMLFELPLTSSDAFLSENDISPQKVLPITRPGREYSPCLSGKGFPAGIEKK